MGANAPSGVAGKPRDLVFVSYSHTDSKWLDRLSIFLKPYIKQGRLNVWNDPYIRVGDRWRREISTALGRTCVGVLLVSPDFIASDFIQDEEVPPLVRGAEMGSIILFAIPISASAFKITPLARYQWAHDPKQPLDQVPKPKRNAILVGIAEEIEKAVSRSAAAPAAPVEAAVRKAATLEAIAITDRLAVLHGVPGQRPNYLRRDDYFESLKQAVLSTMHQAVGITGAVPAAEITRIGLHGMGGIGKTVLAIDLVNTEEIRRAFPDGIFWLTIGQNPEPLRLQGELARFIAGEPRAISTVHDGRDQLRQLFEGNCLLVLDDLWRLQDAEPFDVLGPRSRLLTTTRNADLLVALGARELPLDVLSEDLALELLASWSGQARQALPSVARQVAESCGYLPLALALAGARVRGGGRWEDVLAALERGQLEFLDHPYGSVFKSLRMSVAALPETEARRYSELAVYPEDTLVPTASVCRLWRHTGGLEDFQSRDLLHRLQRKALLYLSNAEEATDLSFHDLQHDFLRLNIESLAAVHGALIEAYRAACRDGWASGPNDGYFFPFLPHHLEAAGRLDELKALLADYAWIEAKLKATDVQAVISDYDLVANEPDLTLVQRALRLSMPALSRDPMHLPSQLIGRLREIDETRIQGLLEKAERGPGGSWLCPKSPSLIPPGPLLQMLAGHTDVVRAVALLPDGQALSGSYDGTLRLWDLGTGSEVRRFEGRMGRITEVAVLPDGRWALSGSYDGTLRLWDLEAGQEIRQFQGHKRWINALVVLPDGRRALSGSADETLRLWDLETGQEIRQLQGHECNSLAVLPDGRRALSGGHERNSLAVLPDSRRALSGSDDGTLRLWDLETGSDVCRFEHAGSVTAVAVLPGGRQALSGSDDGTLRLWDLETGSDVCRFEHAGSVTAVAALPGGRQALSGSADGMLRLWDLETGREVRRFEGHAGSVTAVVALPDGRRALSASANGTLRLWDLERREMARLAFESGVTAVVALPGGRQALSGSADGTLRLWDLETGQEVHQFEGHAGSVTAVAALPGGRRALSGCADGTLRLWDLRTGRGVRRLSGSSDVTLRLWDLGTGHGVRRFEGNTGRSSPRPMSRRITAVVALPDGRRALSASANGTLRLWDLGMGEAIRRFKGHTGPVTAVVALPDGRRALSASANGTLRLWDLGTGREVRRFKGHTGPVTAVVALPDGRRALSASDDQTLRLWDLEAGTEIRRFEGHADWLTAVTVLPNGCQAISGSADRTLRLWDLGTGREVRRFEGHTGRVTALAVLPGGRRALSASDDQTLRLWDLETGHCIAAFLGDARLTSVVAASKDWFVAGSSDSAVHILNLRE